MGPPLDSDVRLLKPAAAKTYREHMVVVAVLMELPDPKNPGKTYTTTSFDMWRLKDGKADEHWDAARLGPPQMPVGATPPLPQK